MKKLDFESYRDVISDIMETTLKNYFLHGLHPGSFTTALLAGDLYGAAMRADHWNRTRLADLARWIMNNAPVGSYGSYETVDSWLSKNAAFTHFSNEYSKMLVVEAISNTDSANQSVF